MGDAEAPSMEASGHQGQGIEKAWHTNLAEDLHRTTDTIAENLHRTTASALSSARLNHSTRLRSIQDYIPHLKSQYNAYEDAFFKQIKDGLMSTGEYPLATCGIAIVAGFLLMRGPRRFLFRHTVGRLQSEDAQYARAQKNVRELSLSVDLLKGESKKLLERASSAQREMQQGHIELMSAGRQIRRLANSVYKTEAEAIDFMDALREAPGRDALKLRAEVASMASFLKQQRLAMTQRILKISELGVRV